MPSTPSLIHVVTLELHAQGGSPTPSERVTQFKDDIHEADPMPKLDKEIRWVGVATYIHLFQTHC